MVALQEICTLLHNLLQADLFEDVCPNGLQVEGRSEVSSIATAVTASMEVIEAAAAKKASLLLVHHGLFWRNESPQIVGIRAKKIKKLLEANISLLAYHLPLDAHPLYGNNYKAALDLGMEKLVPFQKIGVIGDWNFPHLTAEVRSKLESYYGVQSQFLSFGKPEVKRVAIVSGAGWRELAAAKKAGADLLLTGSFDEPAFHVAKEEGIHFMAVGHAASEKVGPKALGTYLSQKLAIPHYFLDENVPF